MFPFIVKLPNKRVYTSIDFGKGSINYILKAAIGNSSSYVIPVPPDNASTSSLTKKKILQNPSHTSEKVSKSSKSNRCFVIALDRNQRD